MSDAPRPPHELVGRLQDAMDQAEVDVLARLYEHTISPSSRRHLGTFFTPRPLVCFMLEQSDRLLAAPPRTVVDPGAGVGAFTVAAHRHWPHAHIFAVDLNVVTLGLLAARVSYERAREVALVLEDYLAWLPVAAPSVLSPLLIVGNPPYTRHHDLTPAMRRSARRAAGELVPNGMAGLSTYFLAATLRHLRPRDALVLLLPASWIESRYGSQVLRHMWSSGDREVGLHWFSADEAIFPGAKVSAMVVSVGPQSPTSQPFIVTRARIDRDRVMVSDGSEWSDRSAEQPPPLNPWSAPNPWPAPSSPRAVPSRTSLSDIARVRRGVATGCNAFFFLTDEQARQLPRAAYRPALLRLRHCSGDVLSTAVHDAIGQAGHARWLLWLHDQRIVADVAVQAILEKGRLNRVAEALLCKRRTSWWILEEDIGPPDVILSPMTQTRFRAVRNEARVLPSNSMYGIYLREPSIAGAAALTIWLNQDDGQATLRSIARRYGNGLYKVEPRALRSIQIPLADSPL